MCHDPIKTLFKLYNRKILLYKLYYGVRVDQQAAAISLKLERDLSVQFYTLAISITVSFVQNVRDPFLKREETVQPLLPITDF